MTVITMPEAAVLGLPAATKDSPRADFRVSEFEKLIEQKGYRLGWGRACLCPCASINDQTEQADPNCELCEGLGWIYFKPLDYVLDEDTAGDLDDTQERVLEDYNAVVVKGIMTGLAAITQPIDKVSRWVEGMSVVTVRPENKLGYYDRLVGLDSTIVYSEILEAGAEGALLPARYTIMGVNLLRSVTTVYTDVDFGLTDGKIEWMPGKGPSAGTNLAIHYLTMPVWLVTEFPQAMRDTNVKFKTTTPVTPLGNPTQLPVRANVRFEFLP